MAMALGGWSGIASKDSGWMSVSSKTQELLLLLAAERHLYCDR